MNLMNFKEKGCVGTQRKTFPMRNANQYTNQSIWEKENHAMEELTTCVTTVKTEK